MINKNGIDIEKNENDTKKNNVRFEEVNLNTRLDDVHIQ